MPRVGPGARLGRWLVRALRRWSWLNLRLASGAQEWLRRRLTPAGQGVLAATLTAGLFGIDTRQTAAFQVFALGAALLAVAWLARGRRPLGLVARRLLPRHGSVGTPARYGVQVNNTGPRALRGLTLAERLADPRPSRAAFLDTAAPSEARRNALERLFGYPRWEWLIAQARRVEPPAPVAVPDLAPGESLALELALVPTRRGLLWLPGLVLAQTDPLGLIRREVPVGVDRGRPASDPTARLLILPQRWPVRPQPPPGRRRLQPGGVNLAAAVGDSREFIGLRDYLPGDSPRHIHWAAWARCGEPVVKEYQDEYFSRQALVLDTCAGFGVGGGDAKANTDGRERRLAAFECAVSVAASLVEPLTSGPGSRDALLDLVFVSAAGAAVGVGAGSGDGVRPSAPTTSAHAITAGRGVSSTNALLEVLAGLEPAPDDGLAALAEQVSSRAAQLSAVLLVLLDWDAPRRALVAALVERGLPLRVLVCTDRALPAPGDDQPPLLSIDPADPAATLASL